MNGAISALPSALLAMPRSMDSLLFLGADSSESRVNFLLYCILFIPKSGLLEFELGMIMLWVVLSSAASGLSWKLGASCWASSLKVVVTLRAMLSSLPKVARLAEVELVPIID